MQYANNRSPQYNNENIHNELQINKTKEATGGSTILGWISQIKTSQNLIFATQIRNAGMKCG